MQSKSKKKPDQNETPEKPKHIVQRYRDRLSVLRQAQDFSQKDEIPKAVASYNKYLESLANYYEITEDKLHPDLFMKDKNLAEVLLVSQVYWDLAKAYDRSPQLKKECERCLNQFVKFSLGFKFQFINSEMLRKFVKKKAAYNPKFFESAFEKLKMNSKACYIATFSLENDPITLNSLRNFKFKLMNNGHSNLVEKYYQLSPLILEFFDSNFYFSLVANSILLRPFLRFLSKIV